jgi:hypothetical protein
MNEWEDLKDGFIFVSPTSLHWRERVRSSPAFRQLVGLGVPEPILLEAVVTVRTFSADRSIRHHTRAFLHAAIQLRAAACALEQLPHAEVIARTAASKVERNGIQFEQFASLLDSRCLAPMLRKLAETYDHLAIALKPHGQIRDKAKFVFLQAIPHLVSLSTGRMHDDEVAELYGFVFETDPPSNFVRLRQDAQAKRHKLL